MKTDKTAEIYIHVPFCKRKCDYCDFVSFVTSEDIQNRYFDMLCKEIEFKAESMGELPIDSVFFGGGTPSLVDERNIARVLETLSKHFKFTERPEISLEMNPNSAKFSKILEYKKAGINRISIGLQTTDDNELKTLSRLHNYSEFLDTYENVRKAGFSNVNIDLMSAIPGQTMASFEKTLMRVSDLNPEHISAYSLIVEEGTPFYERYSDGNGIPDEDEDREMYHFTKEYLASRGYMRYEISNYSKPGFECKHNLGYWRRVPYIGFGIAAASLYDDIRYSKHESLEKYLTGDFTEEKTLLSIEDMKSEFMFLGLRLTDGISVKEFERLFNTTVFNEYGEAIERLTKEELLIINGDRIYLSDRGMDLANYCMAMFV